MKVTREKVENREAFLTVEMEPDEMSKALDEAYVRVAKKANIPGFRKGKAPRPILERYLGKESLLDDAINHAVPEYYDKAIKEEKIEPIARPEIEVTQAEPITFKATIPLAPEVKLGDYKSIDIAPEPVNITDEDVNKSVEQLRHEHATWEVVERLVQYGDQVKLDILAMVEDKTFVDQKDARYRVTENAPLPIPGFAGALVGMKAGETKEFKLVIPADYPRTEFAGKEANFKVTLTEVKEEKLPELNDEFAKKANPDLATVDALKERIRNNLKVMAEERARNAHEDKVLDEVVKRSTIEYPHVMIEWEVERILEDRSRQMQQQGIDMEAYLKSLGKSPEDLHEEMHPAAEKRIKGSLALGKVVDEEKIEVTDADINAEIDNMVKDQEKKDELKKILDTPQSRESIKHMLTTRRAINRLTEIAKTPKIVKEEQPK